jgi:hypothetical protein
MGIPVKGWHDFALILIKRSAIRSKESFQGYRHDWLCSLQIAPTGSAKLCSVVGCRHYRRKSGPGPLPRGPGTPEAANRRAAELATSSVGCGHDAMPILYPRRHTCSVIGQSAGRGGTNVTRSTAMPIRQIYLRAGANSAHHSAKHIQIFAFI